jgi:heme/copper-type cytochrome/quinol oxidase subunit 1
MRPELVGAPPRRRPRWIELATSGDHKDVGLLYLGAALAFLFLAVVELVLMRLQLAVPENTLLKPVEFNRLLSLYGATAVFLFGLPVAAGLISYVVPLQIGARSVAFPRLNLLSWWLWLCGGVALYGSLLFTPSEAGVNPLAPLSDHSLLPNNGVDAWLTGVGLCTLGFLFFAINMAVTLRNMRAPGMAYRRMPPFSWAGAVWSYTMLVAGSVFLAALTMLMLERHFSGVYFDSGAGGAPLLWQHFSWLFLSAAYALMLVPAFGAISEIIPAFSRRDLASRNVVAASLVAIAVLGSLAWMQNMYSAPVRLGFEYFAMVMALALVIPVGMLLWSWIEALIGGTIQLRAPLLFALGAISTASVGLAAELVQSVIPVNLQLANTTDATAATHYALIGGSVFGIFAALYYWYPKLTGRTMGEALGRASFWAMLVGVHATFLPLFLAGLEGQPADVYKYFDTGNLATYNLISTIGAVILAVGIVLTLVNALLGIRSGVPAGHDPWAGDSLEWYALSPPPVHNFDVLPDVRGPHPLRDIRDAVRSNA